MERSSRSVGQEPTLRKPSKPPRSHRWRHRGNEIQAFRVANANFRDCHPPDIEFTIFTNASTEIQHRVPDKLGRRHPVSGKRSNQSDVRRVPRTRKEFIQVLEVDIDDSALILGEKIDFGRQEDACDQMTMSISTKASHSASKKTHPTTVSHFHFEKCAAYPGKTHNPSAATRSESSSAQSLWASGEVEKGGAGYPTK